MKGYIKITAMDVPEELRNMPGTIPTAVSVDMNVLECSGAEKVATVLELMKSFRFTQADFSMLFRLFADENGTSHREISIEIPKIRREARE